VVIAMQFFDGDVERVRKTLGDGDATNAALAGVLAAAKRYDEAADLWSRLDADARIAKHKTLGDSLIAQFVAARKFRLAARVSTDLQTEGEKPTTGQIANSGFEGGVKLRSASIFEWNIADRASPQIGLSDSQRRSGKYSLFILFDSFETAAFRQVSQTVPVEPGGIYEFEAFYRNDVKSPALFKWEIADAATTAAIASSPALSLAGDWTTLRSKFTVPADSDGIVIRFVREGCSGPTCPTNGRISFDDISIRRL
jgi:hypothetical protein